MVTKFSKQGIQPDPREVDYWIDITADPYGSVIKYFNGDTWDELVAYGEFGMSPYDYYTKKQINEMLNNKADAGSVDSKVDDTEIANLVKNIEVQSLGDNGIQLIILKYDNTNVGITMPVASNTTPGIVTATDFINFVKQHQLQRLYTEMYDLLADIREKYQPRLKAGKNISIDRTTNTISATGKLAIDWDNIHNRPDIPTKVSELENDSSFISSQEVYDIEDELAASIASVKSTADKNAAAINVLNGTGVGSVDKKVSDAIASLVDSAPEDLNTLKEIADYIASDKVGAAQMSNAIAANATAIENEILRSTETDEELSDKINANAVLFNDKITTTITEHDASEAAHPYIQNQITAVGTDATEALTLSNNAVDVAYEFAQVAENARITSEAARNAISSLEGITDADTSALMVAELIAKVE